MYKRYLNLLSTIVVLLHLGMLGLTLEQVIARYLLNASSIAIQELQWHLFGCVFLLSGALALRADEHVRVDIVYQRLHRKTRSIIDILGGLFFLLPTCFILIYFGILDVELARSYPRQLDDFRPLLWLQDESAWADSWLFELEGRLVDFLFKGEASANPSGLPGRWAIKAMMPLSALLLFIECLAHMLTQAQRLFKKAH